jgi:hypothetical protein
VATVADFIMTWHADGSLTDVKLLFLFPLTQWASKFDNLCSVDRFLIHSSSASVRCQWQNH